MDVEALKSRIIRSIAEYYDDYFVGWGNHNNHYVKALNMDRIVVDYPKFKMRLYCLECDKVFTEIWGIQ